MDNLPLEITEKIFSGLPMVPRLQLQRLQLQCRAVCTTWRSLMPKPKPKMVLIYGVMSGNTEAQFYFSEKNNVDDEQVNCFGTLEKLNHNLTMPESPAVLDYTTYRRVLNMLRETGRETFMVGSCNGLVCYAGYPNPLSLSCERNVYICNPLTGEQIQAPSRNWSGNTYTELAIGFGYNHSSDEYKVVRILRNNCCADPLYVTVHVHTLQGGTNVWRKKSSIIENPLVFNSSALPLVGVFACGALHWIDDQHSKKDVEIVAFDMEHDEKLELLPSIPSVGCNRYDRHVRVMELGGNLCVLEVVPGKHVTTVWELIRYKETVNLTQEKSEYGTPWVTKFSIAWEDYSWFDLYAVTKSDICLGWYNAVLSCYDPETKTLTKLDETLKKLMDRRTPSLYHTNRATPHVHSLVSLGSDYGGKTWKEQNSS